MVKTNAGWVMLADEILLNGENQYVEFKEKLDNPDSIASEIVAFLNSEGGNLIIGIKDNGEVVGIEDFKKLEEQVNNICRFNCIPECVPAIDIEKVREKNIAVINISKGVDKPYRTNQGHYYIRVGSTKRKASREELSRLFQMAGFIHFDEEPVPGSSIDDIDKEKVKYYYLKVFNKSIDNLKIDLLRFYENIKIARVINEKTYASVAGILLFGKSPQDLIPHSKISAVRFSGKSVSSGIIDRKELNGTLPELISEAEAFFLRNTSSSSEIHGTIRKDIYEYPLEVFRELIVNATVHRNYSISGAQIRLFIFSDKLEIRSPGRLPNTITIENIRYGNHFTRNPLIAKLMINLGYMEDIGLGIPKVYDLMLEHNKTEPVFENEYEFIARVYKDGSV